MSTKNQQSTMSGTPKLEGREFRFQIGQCFIQDCLVTRVLAGFHLVQDPRA